MAGRIIYQPFIGLSGAIVTYSSQQLTFPARRLRDPSPAAVWRSKLGWNIVEGVNDKLDLVEDISTVVVATLTPGNYETGDLMATEIQTALDAAGSNTYTVTYSPTTFKFTIARATGALAVSLPFDTGNNFLTSAHHDFGFADTDLSSATTYTADSVSYHSREWITVQTQTAVTGKVALALNHNVSANGTIEVMANASDAWTAPSFSDTLDVAGAGPLDLDYVFFASEQTYAYWHHLVDDVQNPVGYTEVGIFHVSGYVEPAIDYAIQWNEDREELSQVGMADRGASLLNEKPTRTSWGLHWPALVDAEKDDFDTFFDYVHLGRPFFFAFDPDDDDTFIRYCLLKGSPRWSRVPPTYWAVQVGLQTVLA